MVLVRQTGALGRWHAAQRSGGAPSKTISSGATPTALALCGGRRVTSSQASGFRAALRPLAPAGGSQSIRLYFGAQTAWHSLDPSIRMHVVQMHIWESLFTVRSSLGRQTQTILDLNIQCQFQMVVLTFIALLSA